MATGVVLSWLFAGVSSPVMQAAPAQKGVINQINELRVDN